MELRQWVLVGLSAITLACEPTEQANQSGDAAAIASDGLGGADMMRPNSANTPNGPANGGTSDAGAGAPVQAVGDGGTVPPGRSDASASDDARAPSTSGDADTTRASSDAAAQRPDWEGLVTLDASITTGPDGAVINGGFPHYDAAAAGPILNAQAQTACLTLANDICGRSADCQISLTQLPAAQRSQLIASCEDTFFRLHNCNRAVSTASGLSACSESVKTRDCLTVFADDFATSCVDQITFQP